MAERPHPAEVGVRIGDVYGSQLIIGDHNIIQTPDGAKVTVLQVGERPKPRLRQLPVTKRPAAIEVFGREDEVALGCSAAAGNPVQVHAPDGAGKTSLLKAIALRAEAPAEGVLFESTRRRTLDEIELKLYTAFWESDVPYLPGPADVGGFLAEREALLVLDDCELDRDDLDLLLDLVPRSTVISASEHRTLWSRGAAQTLAALDPEAALKLFERELGRAIEPEERGAAEAVVAELGGHPQSLVEAAASIAEGGTSLHEIAVDPGARVRRADPSGLSDSQRRILDVLSALDGAPLGVEHIAVLADAPNALPELKDLERRGWAKAASPRYRLVRPLPKARGAAVPDPALTGRLLGHLARWSKQAPASEVVEEATAIEAALDLEAASERWNEALELTLAAEAKLTLGGAWSAGRRTLHRGLKAAQALGDDAARAFLLHQLGSLALCLGDDQEAVARLGEALQIRERLGDRPGTDVTRHNLGQMGGGNGSRHNGGNGGGPWRPRLWILLSALGLVAVGLIAGLLTGGGGGNGTTAGFTDHATTPKRGKPPAIAIERPADDATFKEGSSVTASYSCAAAEGVQLKSCEGTVGNGDPIDTSVGEHEFAVTAVDSAGRKSTRTVTYVVTASSDHHHREKPPPPGQPPTIAIERPADDATFKEGSSVTASYSCAAAEGVQLKSCEGTVGNGDPIDTSVGEHEFAVTAVDSAGRKSTRTVRYIVKSSDDEPPTISIASPAPESVYRQDQEVVAKYACDDGGSGVATCKGTVPNGGQIETATAGEYTFTVTATDKAGNPTTQEVRYQVAVD